ncbi:hypothetical protein [Streptomyces sp. NPDC056883]|uniref:hypothetical protein n=1 Tax=Streptomyces sp. NPDC056883 TaxID=3345959 RepID=UPI00368F764A
MDKARLYQNDTIGKRVFAREIDDEPWWRSQKVPLICPFCGTRVVSQRTTVGRAPRGALFRLAADQLHEAVCPLNPTEVLQKIAHGSQGVATIHGDELHLALPDDMGQIDATAPIADPGATGNGGSFGVDISTVHPLLPPLINSAVVIARFLQKHGFDADVVAQFKVRRRGEKAAVSWSEFCHGPAPADQARLHERLAGGLKPKHPVAVYGRVTTVEYDGQDRPVLRLADGSGFTVRIRSQHPSLLSPLTVGTYVLAVGTWKVWTPRRGRPELQLFAEEHWQLAHWTYDNVTGRNSAPACPPPLSLAQRALRQARTAAATPKPSLGRAAGPSPRPRSSEPRPPITPAPAARPPIPPAPADPVAAPAAHPKPTDPPIPAVPEPAPALAPPELPAPATPLPPPRPAVPPRPTAVPRLARRGWWLFGRRR